MGQLLIVIKPYNGHIIKPNIYKDKQIISEFTSINRF
jgi:hypothetical protein